MDTAAGDRTIEARSSGRRHIVGLIGALAGLVLVAAAGCGGDGVGDGVGDASRGQTGTTAITAAPEAAEPSCEDGSLDDRAYVLCATAGTTDQRLVVALHGRGSSADEMRTVTQLDR
jgi:hypothetical protein